MKHSRTFRLCHLSILKWDIVLKIINKPALGCALGRLTLRCALRRLLAGRRGRSLLALTLGRVLRRLTLRRLLISLLGHTLAISALRAMSSALLASTLRRVEHLHIAHLDLGAVAILPALVLPLACVDASLGVDLAALLDVLLDDLG